MAVALFLGGGRAIFLVVPLFGALAIWCAFVTGRRLGGPLAGIAAAALLACSPTFLYQLVQPMSDVPAAALWLAALALALECERAFPRDPRLGGRRPRGWRGDHDQAEPGPARDGPGAAGVPVGLRRARHGRRPGARHRRGGRTAGRGLRRAVAIGLWRSRGTVRPEPRRAEPGALSRVARRRAHTRHRARAAGTANRGRAAADRAARGLRRARHHRVPPLRRVQRLVVHALPAAWHRRADRAHGRRPGGLDAEAAEIRAGGGRAGGGRTALGGIWVARAETLSVFRLQSLERKYVELGRYGAASLPPTAVVIAGQATGSVRFYAGLPTLSWDAIDPAWLDRTLDELRRRGRTPYFAIEAWEIEPFRLRFGGRSNLAALDWPPRASIGQVIFVYGADDRGRYLAGETFPTQRITWR